MGNSVNQSATPPGSASRAVGAGRPAGSGRREAIFKAALRLFRQRGFHGTSINEIGDAAGVSGPAIYRHFASKGEVLAEAIRDGSRRIGAVTRDARRCAGTDPARTLETLVRAYVEVALENADVFAAYVLESRHLEPGFRTPLWESERRHREDWMRILCAVHPGLDEHSARTVVSMAVFSVAALCMEASPLDRPALVELATERVLALLGGAA